MTRAQQILEAAGFSKDERGRKLQAVWRGTHRDYKGTLNGQRHIMVLRQGGSHTVPLEDLTDEEINSRLPKETQKT